MPGKIIVKGAREHNLKNIDLEIPRDQLVVITGVSGSGKSSLAFDTLYAEGQRRYVESLSAYARQFLEQMERPEVDSIEGLSPAISIEQKSAGQNPRSTVGTGTEIYDYLRLLFARAGKVECYRCGREISAQTVQQIVDQLPSLPRETQIYVLAPIAAGRKGEYRRERKETAQAGFARVKIDGQIYELGEEITLKKNRPHVIDLVVDRLVMREGIEKRLADSVETASRYGGEVIKVEAFSAGGSGKSEEIIFSQKYACVHCGVSYPELTPRLFSFNSPHGACDACGGLGSEADADGDVEDPARRENIHPCKESNGARLKRASLHVKIGEKSIAEITSMPIKEALKFLTGVHFGRQEKTVAGRILKEISSRLNFMVEVGLDYLTLNRPSATLSGGEAQRIRLATQIGSSLVGVLYILDEPSIGLHQRDHARLLETLKRLRDLGNTVLVVEHDEETIRSADFVVDLGPGAGELGGHLVAVGTPDEIVANPASLTGRYLARQLAIPVPAARRKGSGSAITIHNPREHNLKGMAVKIPLGTFTAVTGVSGSGKSTLVNDILYRALAQMLHRARDRPGAPDRIEGAQRVDKVVDIDQSPIGRTPRSNPATYTGVFTFIRTLFARTPEARMRGYQPGRFSFNVKGGRCEACQGDGLVKIEMHFLPDVYVTCDVCKARRYNRETLDVRYKSMSIAEVLDMTVREALAFFEAVPVIKAKLQTLDDVGLDYIRLGQSATTPSGGEAQRVKLATELSRRATGRTLYILDEPTTGLHFADIQRLLDVLNRLVDQGNTVVIIEHNLDVIKTADWIIDLGPEGGDEGGRVVATGTPEDLAGQADRSYTGQFLGPLLAGAWLTRRTKVRSEERRVGE